MRGSAALSARSAASKRACGTDAGASSVAVVSLSMLQFQRAASRVLGPIGVLASAEPELHGGVDIGPLAEVGVPVFTLAQDGTRYFDLHHTADDTLDKIDPKALAQNVAAYTVFAYLAAEADGGFGSEAKNTVPPNE